MFNRKEYQKTFAQVHASEEILTEVLKMTKQHKPRTLGRVTRALILAAVLSAMLATTAFAYVGFTRYENPMEMLKSFFGSDEYHVDNGSVVTVNEYGQRYDLVEPTTERVPLDTKVVEEDVAPYVSAVGQSISYKDYTLTVDAHLHDASTGCGVLYYRLEPPNGVSGYELQSNGEIWWPDGEKVDISAFGRAYIMEETTDTSLAVAYYYDAVYGSEIRLTFYQWILGKPGEVPAGEIEDFESECQVMMIPLYEGMASINLADGDIVLSPIAMTVNVQEMDFLSLVLPSGEAVPPRVDQIDHLAIRYEDGTEFVVQHEEDGNEIANYASAGVNPASQEIRYVFNRIVDIKKVTTVIINDVEFPVNP